MQRSNSYTLIFVFIVSSAAAIILSVASYSFKDRQILNVEIDMKKNILTAAGIFNPEACREQNKSTVDEDLCCDVPQCYESNIKSILINSKGNVIETEIKAESLNFENELEKPATERQYPVYIWERENRVISYCIPIIGKGLWSTLYGYIAFEPDFSKIKGLTFYKHGETPGLGAEIEADWFTSSFVQKRIFGQNNELISITVLKGKSKADSPMAEYEVDGITGATITSKSVEKLLRNILVQYTPFMKRIRKEGASHGR